MNIDGEWELWHGGKRAEWAAAAVTGDSALRCLGWRVDLMHYICSARVCHRHRLSLSISTAILYCIVLYTLICCLSHAVFLSSHSVGTHSAGRTCFTPFFLTIYTVVRYFIYKYSKFPTIRFATYSRSLNCDQNFILHNLLKKRNHTRVFKSVNYLLNKSHMTKNVNLPIIVLRCKWW